MTLANSLRSHFAPLLFCCLVMLGLGVSSAHAESDDLGTRLSLCTFKLTDGKTNGTAFILQRGEAGASKAVLITAGHVLLQMPDDTASLIARQKKPDGSYEKLPITIKVRENKQPLWVKHPEADVAAMLVTMPAEVELPHISVDLLATDELLTKYEVHPGDLLRCVGFPHAGQFEPHPAGFPVVRVGCLATYPLLPSKQNRTILFDFNTFEGDSGASVYLEDNRRYYGGQTHDERVQLIVGLVYAQHFLDESYKTVYQSGSSRHRMGLALVIQAATIRETLEMLDKPR